MFGIHSVALFVVSGFLLNITPGPDTLFIMSRSAAHGWRAGSVAALGICSGVFVHILAAALGLSAVLATSATAFTVVKFIGAAYLIYVGIGLLRSKRGPAPGDPAAKADSADAAPVSSSYRKIFVQGFFTNVLNPKVALFFLAFVPQFILPESSNKALAFIVLGCLFNFNSLLWSQFVAVASAHASRSVRVSRRVAQWLNRVIGVVFISFGLRLMLAKP